MVDGVYLFMHATGLSLFLRSTYPLSVCFYLELKHLKLKEGGQRLYPRYLNVILLSETQKGFLESEVELQGSMNISSSALRKMSVHWVFIGYAHRRLIDTFYSFNQSVILEKSFLELSQSFAN